MMFEQRFRKEFPELLPVEGDEHSELLLWAHRKGYCQLTAAPTGALYYSPQDLKAAQMWREKDNG